jgi:hypothetical protein
MDYSAEEAHGEKVAPALASYYMDLANPVMMGVGPNQISNIDYGSAAGVKYLVATVENFKPLALKDLYVDFSLSLDGEEFYYQIYQIAMAVNSEGRVVALGTTNGRDRASLMRDKVLPKVIAAAKKSESGSEVSALELAEVRRSYAKLMGRRARIAASETRAAPSVESPVTSGFSALFFAAGLFATLMAVTFVGSRYTGAARTVNVGNPLLGEP